MDFTDFKILEILQKDGRISMKDLGKKVSMSPPAVAERVRRLEESGIITGYKAVINPEKIGKNINVLINMEIKVDRLPSFFEFTKECEQIVECHHVTGSHSMVIKACLDIIDSLEGLLGKLQIFGNTETYIILSSPIKDKILMPSKKFNLK